MRSLSYEKCVCFVLLVIVAFLSCAGFRIDRSEMTNLFSRRNSHTSNSLEYRSTNSLFLDKLVAISINSDINTATTNIRQQHNNELQRQRRSPTIEDRTFDESRYGRSRHKIRHARKLQRLGQAALIELDRNSSEPKAWIDVHVIETKNASETDRNLHHHHRPPPITLPLVMTTSSATTSDLIAQIPPSDLVLPRPTHEIINRLQRSPFKRKHRQKRKKKRINNHCQKQDLARNAYVADTVMLARAESMSLNRTVNANYSVTFRIIEMFKSKEPRNSETIRLTFIYSRKAQNCEPRHESRLVKANIKKMKEYFLFLKSDGSYSYSVYRTPMLRKKENRRKGGGKRDGDRRRNGNNSNDAQIAIVRKVCNATFEPTLQLPQIEYIESEKTITCSVKGFPIPIITWIMNDSKISSDLDRRQIVYNRRNSTLTIGKNKYGVYKCMATIGSKTSYSTKTFEKEDGMVSFAERPCERGEAYCMNGGECYMIQSLGERYCRCVGGYAGQRCDQKSSTYQQNLTSCNLPHYKDEHFCKE